MLYDIGKKNPSPRWKIFTDSYEQVFGKIIDTENFFSDYQDPIKFSSLYHFNYHGPFQEFQSKFNLIIALAKFDEDEIRSISSLVTLEHAKQGIEHAEFRIMFAVTETRPIVESKIIASCEGLQAGSELANKAGYKIEPKLAVSLHRNKLFLEQYIWLKELQSKNSLVRDYLSGIDFCHIEEGYPPSEKKEFFEQVLADNLAQPDLGLAILYHVGESYQDKTPHSASRWVLESALYGAHRLGHCIALGIRPQYFLNKKRLESVSERTQQLEWERKHSKTIQKYGYFRKLTEIESNLAKLKDLKPDSLIEIVYDEREVTFLETFQNYCMAEIKKTSAVIESCPSSNFYIGMIEEKIDHPLHRFIENDLRVTIGADDPGIFNTNIQEEYKKAKEMGIKPEDLDLIRAKSFEYTSEKLSRGILSS
ncbi:adenosine deaminase [Leptospira sp. GIMC2001]|uniref:adenosine deaminase n=1 Tax=Leptospira sp. GIMC2001 TaxID=1513297 RepID=UPI00234A7596|nr:adenosine deaminase [Leptospira sp. GIMC2001]WCL49436.1 adenosine deaminase [Leptospira sp. GIMC2001]